MIAIDVYFLLNFCFNLLLIQMVVYLQRYRRCLKRMAAGAAIGAGWSTFALIADWLPVPAVIVMHWFVCPWLICKASCCPVGRRQTLVAVFCFYLTAFVTGGAMNAVYGMAGERYSFVTLLLSMAVMQLLIIVLLRIVKHEEDSKTLFCKVKLEFRGRKAETVGIWDTGNRLCSLTKRPVHLMDQIGIRALLNQDELEAVFRLQHEFEEGTVKDCSAEGILLHRIPFCGIGASDDWLFAFEIEQMTVYRNGREIQVKCPLIGMSKTIFCEGKDYGIILNPQDI